MAGFDVDLPIDGHIQAYLEQHGATPDVSHRFDNMDTLKSAVAVTDQFAILPTRCVAREVEAGSLVAVRLMPKLTRPMGVLTPPTEEGLTPASKAFLKELLAFAGQATDRTKPDPARTRAGKA